MSEPAERPDEYTPFAHEELAKFYEEWPGGRSEERPPLVDPGAA